MHERTQRAVARLLFVFCCAVPTSIVFTTILVTWTSWYQSKKLAEITYNLGRETGLVFAIDDCRMIAPGKYILENVRVSDPDSGLQIATIRMIDYFRGTDRVGIFLHQPELQSAGLGLAWSVLHDRLISCQAHTILPTSIVATDVNIRSGTGSLPPLELSAEITPEGQSVRMIAHASDPAGRSGPRIRVNLFRNRESTRPATELVLSTEGTALPCSAVAEYAPSIAALGPEAEFSGTIKCNETPTGWCFDLGSSSLRRMNLSYLTESLPHRVIGEADVRLRRCFIRPGQITSIIGTFHASDVRVKPALLAAMQDYLGMAIDFGVVGERPNGIECKLAAMDFEISDETMKLTGICNDFHAGIGNNVAIYARGRAIAVTAPARIESDQLTTMLQPPSRSVAAWNKILLPSPPVQSIAERPTGGILRVGNSTGEATIRQE
jgi:hypothetical protein